MNKEEQEAIENIKKDFILMNNGEYAKTDKYILYNLISKQQKENEELKELNNAGIEKIRKLEKENYEYFKQLDLDYVDNNFISKDKIKAKIKDIKRELEILEKKNDCSMIYNPKDICKAEILRLKELLEGE